MLTEERIWNKLIVAGMTPAGAAGSMGNQKAESDLNSRNLQNSFEKKLGYTDDTYTAAVDSGAYTNFAKDGAGYGLCQWTYHTRKAALLAFVQAAGKSIGDEDAQVDFYIKELKESYPKVWAMLTTTTSVREASDAVLLNYERPADQSEAVRVKRAGYGQTYYDKYATGKEPEKGSATMGFTSSSLATAKQISPNKNSPRTHAIDTITIHCFVGQVTAQRGCEVFQPSSKQASCNYVVGKDGDIGLCVEEKDRSWCSSSASNDHRAVTIEVASDTADPYAVTDKAYAALLDLVTDICRRNGKSKITWLGDKAKTLAYTPAANEMVMTVHRWFANKACPGAYLYERHPAIAAEVNKRLGGSAATTPTTSAQTTTPAATVTEKKATEAAKYLDKSLAGTYTVNATSGLHIRSGAGASKASMIVLPNGTKVQNYGYYTPVNGVKWLYIQVTYQGVKYTGFSSGEYLKKQ